MAIRLTNIAGALAAFFREPGSNGFPQSGEGLLAVSVEDPNGGVAMKTPGLFSSGSPYHMPVGGMNDGSFMPLRVDRTGGIATADFQPIVSWMPEGTAINGRVFQTFLTTMTATQSTSGITLNASNLTTLNTNAQLNTWALAPRHMKAPLLMRARFRVTQAGVSNANAEYGFATVSTTLGQTPNLNGAYWRFDSNGVQGVVAFNGTVVATTANYGFSLNLSDSHQWGVLVEDDSVTFTCQTTSTGELIARASLQIPGGQLRAFLASHLQPYLRVFNSSTAPVTPTQLILSELTVGLLDINLNMSMPQVQTALGLGSEAGPLNYTTTSNLTNAAVVPTQTLSNTATGQAALDGGVRFAAPVGAATNDFTLFSYTVPAGYRYRTKRVLLAAKNLGAAVATTPTQIDFFLVVNGNGVTLVGNLFRKYVGTQTFPVGSAVGSAATEGPLQLDLTEGDLITEPGRVIGLMCRISTGTATASQVIEVMYTNVGHFE